MGQDLGLHRVRVRAQLHRATRHRAPQLVSHLFHTKELAAVQQVSVPAAVHAAIAETFEVPTGAERRPWRLRGQGSQPGHDRCDAHSRDRAG